MEALGPTGARVAARLKQVRLERGLTLAELAAKLEGLGRPLLLSALSKIEQCQRRVDADDLVALARALDVSPTLLLLPPDTSADTLVQLTESDSVNASQAWQWMTLQIPVHSGIQQARSSYLEQVRRIAPAELIGREAEFSELADFCLQPDRGSYAWWQAGPWAGKTALLSTFVLRPPAELAERVQIVSFFITARLAAQDTRDGFTRVLLEQLAALLGQPVPPVLAEATREVYLLDLLSQAAVACEDTGKRLVLVVDGLDEDQGMTSGPGVNSIAGLLPADPPAGMRVIVTGRPHPPVPADVPDQHPLRDPTTIRPLAASSHVGDVTHLAYQELQRLLASSTAGGDVLGFLTVARRGLTSRELTDLVNAPPREIESVLRTVAGRTFTSQAGSSVDGEHPEVYVIAHEELQAQAEMHLEDQLQWYRDRFQEWTDGRTDRDSRRHQTAISQNPAAGLGTLLRQLRVEAGMTQDELADATGMSPRTISDLERGVNLTARRDTAGLLADGLGLAGPERERFLAVSRGRQAPAEPSSRASAAVASNVTWLEQTTSTAFVGRERELGVLRDAWADATAGHRVLALVSGEPGIGKTALVAELARQVRDEEGLVLYGRWDEHVLAPYQAFREALSDYARACPEGLLRQDLTGLAGEIARMYPVPASRVGVPAAPPLAAAEAERFRLFESLDTWLGRMAARHPVLLVLDDLHWADQSSLLLLPHLMRAARSTPLLVAAMYRNTVAGRNEFETALPSLSRDIDCRRLPLRGLERHAVATLLECAVGRPFGQRESGMVAMLERETAGNPFFLLEMARHLSESDAFNTDADIGSASLDEPGTTPGGIPESARDMIRSRLRQLSDGCAEILAIASLVGDRFDADLLASAASLDDTVITELLEEAARAGLITEIDEGADGEPDHWRFFHSLTRRVTAEELSRSRRARLHHQIGEALESRPGVPPARLAHHFGASARSSTAEKTVGYERLAGERALREVAAEVAVRHFRRALELLDRFGSGDQVLRCEVLLELAGAHDRAGEYALRDERFAEAADAARRAGSDDLLRRAALGYGGIIPATVAPDPRAQALLTEALERTGEEVSGARATILARLAHWLHNARPYPERLTLSDRAVAMARYAGDRRTLAVVLLHRCFTLEGPGDVDDALKVAGEIGTIAHEVADPELTLESLRVRLAAQFEKGDQRAAEAAAREMRTLAEEVGHPEFICLAAMWDVTVANLEGRFTDAEELGARLDRRLQRLGHPQADAVTMTQTFVRRWMQGHAAEFIPVFEALSASNPANHAWPAAAAWCLAEADAHRRATALLRRIGPSAATEADKNYQWWAVIVGLADAASLTGDTEQARVLYDLAAPYAGNNCTLGTVAFLGAADHWLGVLAGAAGRYDEAIAHLDAALARHQDMGARPWIALTQEAYVNVLAMRGRAADADRASALRKSAMITADELGLAVITHRPRQRG